MGHSQQRSLEYLTTIEALSYLRQCRNLILYFEFVAHQIAGIPLAVRLYHRLKPLLASIFRVSL